jgi:hypothetical protein
MHHSEAALLPNMTLMLHSGESGISGLHPASMRDRKSSGSSILEET